MSASEPESPLSRLQAEAGELPAASRRSQGLLCVQPGKTPRNREADPGKRWKISKSQTSEQMAAGATRWTDRGPRPRAASARQGASRGSRSLAPRRVGGWKNPERPDPRKRGARGARSATRLRGPGIPGKARSGPRPPADLEGERPNSHRTRVTPGPGVRACVCVCESGKGRGACPKRCPPTPMIRALLCVVPLALQAAQSCRSKCGEGRSAHGRDPRGDGGSHSSFAECSSRLRTARGAHLVAPARLSLSARTLAGLNLKGLPGPVPRRALLRRRPG